MNNDPLPTQRYRPINRTDWRSIFWRLGLLMVVMAVGPVLLGPALIFLWPLVFLAPLAWIVRWHTRSFAYRCRNCGQVFEISFWRNLISPHGPGLRGGGWKYLRCPRCGEWTRAEVLRIRRGAESGPGE